MSRIFKGVSQEKPRHRDIFILDADDNTTQLDPGRSQILGNDFRKGCQKSDKFIGKYGAIVCLPSLPQTVKSATDAGVDRLYIAIDEVDFCYNLLSLSIEQATAVKSGAGDTRLERTGNYRIKKLIFIQKLYHTQNVTW